MLLHTPGGSRDLQDPRPMGWVPGTHGTSVQTAALVREWCGEEGCKLGSDSSWTNLLLTAPLLSHPPIQGSPQDGAAPGTQGPRSPSALEADLPARSQGCLWWAGMSVSST